MPLPFSPAPLSPPPSRLRPARIVLLLVCLVCAAQGATAQVNDPDASVIRLQDVANYGIGFSAPFLNGVQVEDPAPGTLNSPVPVDDQFDLLFDSPFISGQVIGTVVLGGGSAAENLGPSIDVTVDGFAEIEAPEGVGAFNGSPGISSGGGLAGGSDAFASGSVSYRAAIIKLHPDAPDGVEIPISYTAVGQAAVLEETLLDVVTPRGQVFDDFGAATATASARVAFGDNLFEACAGVDCGGLPAEFMEEGSFSLGVFEDVLVSVAGGVEFDMRGLVEAQLDADNNFIGNTVVVSRGDVSAQVVASAPVFSLDSSFQVPFLDGTASATDVLTLAISQGIDFTGSFPTTSPFASGCQPDPSVNLGFIGPLADGTTITCLGNDSSGVVAANDELAIRVEEGASVTTGDMQPAFAVQGRDNNLTNEGTIATTGDATTGVFFNGPRNNISNKGVIETNGSNSDVIALQVPVPTDGSVGSVVNEGTIRSRGPRSDAVRVEGHNADLRNMNLIETQQDESDAIRIVGHNADILNEGIIRTLADFSDAIAIADEDPVRFEAIPADRATIVNNGTIETRGDLSAALNLFAHDVFVQNAGTIRTQGQVSPAIGLVGDDGTLENLGTIETAGGLGLGMGAVSQGNTLINNGTLTTAGTEAFGMAAFGAGQTVLNDPLGEISTRGTGAHGIEFGDADAIVLVELIGIALPEDLRISRGDITNLGDVTTEGSEAHGVNLFARDTTLDNRGTIEARGFNAHGVFVDGGSGGAPVNIGDATVLGSNISISNSGVIRANEEMGGVSLLVNTSGVAIENSTGGVIEDGILLNGSTRIFNSGTIHRGIGVFPNEGDTYELRNFAGGTIATGENGINLLLSDVTVRNEGIVTVTGGSGPALQTGGAGRQIDIESSGRLTGPAGGSGIAVASADTARVVNSGELTAGSGIGVAFANSLELVHSGMIATSSVEGIGIDVLNSDIETLINSGSILTPGANATGIRVTDDRQDPFRGIRARIVNEGDISTIGSQAHGILSAVADSDGRTELVQSGTLVTAGTTAHGFVAAVGDAVVTNTGGIGVDGANASAIFADAQFSGRLTLDNAGTLSAPGIAVSAGSASDVVGNSGRITGDVLLRGGSDTFIARTGGLVDGVVDGGADTDSLVADFDAGESLVGDAFVHFENLRKEGAGTLAYSGDLTVDDTRIDAGTLALATGSTLTSPTLTVAAGATLGGGGTVVGDIEVQPGGVVAPGFSAGTLELMGDMILMGTLDIELGGLGSGESDLFRVDGSLDVRDGVIRVSFLDGFRPEIGDRVDFLTLSGGVTGVESLDVVSLGLPSGFEFDLSFAPLDGGGSGLILETTAVPEPGMLVLIGLGLAGLAASPPARVPGRPRAGLRWAATSGPETSSH